MHAMKLPSTRRVALVVALLCAMMAGLGVTDARATVPGAEGKIAFTRSLGSVKNIWSVNPDGTGATQLTTSGKDFGAKWSPDGSMIAFTSTRVNNFLRDVFVMNADGSNQRILVPHSTSDRVSPSWSMDQRKVIYSRNTNGYELWVADVLTGAQTPLVRDGRNNTNAVYSPDGTKLAWSRQTSTLVDGLATASTVELIVANPDGSDPRSIIQTTGPVPGVTSTFALDWLPDSSKLVWGHVLNGVYAVDYVDPVTGSNVSTPTGAARPNEWTVSPQGDKLVKPVTGTPSSGLWLADLNGNTTTRVTTAVSPTIDDNPSWQTVGFNLLPPDTAPPSINIDSPVEGSVVAKGSALTAQYSCADQVTAYGLATCSGPMASGDSIDTTVVGDQTFTVSASDNAGNSSTKTVHFQVVSPDSLAPSITISSPLEGGEVTKGSSLTAQYSCADELGGSGVASCVGTVPNGTTLDTSVVGDKTFVVTSSDSAGNAVSKTVNYRVIWPFGGFRGSIDAPPTVNLSKSGSTVPARFSLGGDLGMNILASGYPKSVATTCDYSAPADAIEESTLSPGNNVLTYDAGSGTYGYNWKTDKAWKGTCRQLVLKLADGATYRANFRFS